MDILTLTEIRDVLLDAGHPQAKWSAPRQWTGGFACKQTTLNEAEVAVYHVWTPGDQSATGRPWDQGAEIPYLLSYQGALLRAGLETKLLTAKPHALLLVSRSAEEISWADPWKYDDVSGVRVG